MASESNMKHVATDVPHELRERMYSIINGYGLTMRGFMRKAILNHVLKYEKSLIRGKRRLTTDVESERINQ